MAKQSTSIAILTKFWPLMRIIPEIQNTDRRILFKSRAIQTIIVVLIYMVCCQIPLYGIKAEKTADQFYWLRVIMASNKGTLMELGISPIVTAGMIVQLLVGSKLIEIDQNDKKQQALYNGIQKLLALIIALVEAFFYVWSGMYGAVSELGVGNAVIILIQLTIAGLLVQLLDEILSKGYGLGNSAISLFIAINVCETIMWKTFSPMFQPNREKKSQLEGSIFNLVYSLVVDSDKFKAISQAFMRDDLPNINSLLSTILIFGVVIYFQGFRVEIPLSSTQARGYRQTYPIKLFYTSNIPIILQSALISNLYLLSQLAYKNFGGNIITNVFGKWQEVEMGQYVPTGGAIYYLTPPRGLGDAVSDPLHTLVYIVVILSSCAFFSKTWIDVSGSSAKDVAKQIKDQRMNMPGIREEYQQKQLNRYISIAASFGGLCIGALSIIADLLGVIGSGTGILLAVTIIYSYFEQIKKEQENGTLELF
eukprot:TRINITY_DN2395_c0_g2_i4.p1 TRINITY_DN2395_c0_g2~~TRINITY_DN2395_c0_g2_i4.p1  ORF type:complete len:479 (+),score=67.17 TRINITY_DN2395_c0_g2_i4:140-1576(+)